jgi:hypothetical protein
MIMKQIDYWLSQHMGVSEWTPFWDTLGYWGVIVISIAAIGISVAFGSGKNPPSR